MFNDRKECPLRGSSLGLRLLDGKASTYTCNGTCSSQRRSVKSQRSKTHSSLQPCPAGSALARAPPPLRTQDVALICENIFDKCLAPQAPGVGCDNMTMVLVVFRENWSRRCAATSSSPTASVPPSSSIPPVGLSAVAKASATGVAPSMDDPDTVRSPSQ